MLAGCEVLQGTIELFNLNNTFVVDNLLDESLNTLYNHYTTNKYRKSSAGLFF